METPGLSLIVDGPRAPEGELEAALLRAHQLIDSMVSLHRGGSTRSSFVPLSGEGAVREAVCELADGARHSVSRSAPGHGATTGHTGAAINALRDAGRRGVRVRMLYAAGALSGEEIWSVSRREVPWEVRVAGGEVRNVLIVDGRVALVSCDTGRSETLGMITEDPALVRTLDQLMAGTWHAAREPVGYQRQWQWIRGPEVRRVLWQLRTGAIDEVAAADLGMSLRTYRRHVAKIMHVLGATSRFQAGMRAVELGLLSETDRT
ncbi:hypothetical protein [Streptomyces alkaliphilus]|uniref:hypothetical protein n=1 Tax=Streptomyces alkaliphilus TaxID=1472722 RepID=UPI0015F86D9A|nr:hypothetical protein [Streptomyces alkaliphilus]